MGKCIGIDLGTTNSCAAHVVNGRPEIIEQPGGLSSLPSVYTIDAEGKEVVGQEAKLQAQNNPEQTVMAAKRLIGRNFHNKNIDDIRQLFTYEVVEGQNSEVLVKIRDRLLTLEEISAAILRRLKDQAAVRLGADIDSAVGWMRKLAADPGLCKRIGTQARQTMIEMSTDDCAEVFAKLDAMSRGDFKRSTATRAHLRRLRRKHFGRTIKRFLRGKNWERKRKRVRISSRRHRPRA